MYVCISPYGESGQWLRIRELKTPWSYGDKWADVARAELDWELVPPYDRRCPIVAGAFFLRSPDGKRLLIVYSANGCWSDDYTLGVLEYQGGVPMLRYMNLQRIDFDETGFPIMGEPVPPGKPMPAPSGEEGSAQPKTYCNPLSLSDYPCEFVGTGPHSVGPVPI